MLSDHVGARITAWRKRQRWNRERLAKECAMLGMPELTAAVLTNIESGRRHQGARRRLINIDELAVIAEALRVPLALLVSSYPDETEVELFPGRTVASVDAYRWLVGRGDQSPKKEFRGEDRQAALVAHLLRQHDDAVEERVDAGRRWSEALHEVFDAAMEAGRRIILRDEDVDVDVLQKMVALAKTIHDLDGPIVGYRSQLRERGWPTPTLPTALEYLSDRTVERHAEIFQFFNKRIRDAIQNYIDYFDMVLRHEP